MKGATFSRWTRLALAGQVLLMGVLALAAVLLVIEVAEWPAARARIDLTHAESSSLDPATVDILEALPERAEVDVFYRVPAEYSEGYVDALERTRRLLRLAESQVPRALSLRLHDANDLARAKGRMDELQITAADISFATPVGVWFGAIVVKVGERRTVARFVPDLCRIDLGDPRRGVPSSVSSWRGEEGLCEALGRTAGGRAPRVAFAQGSDEAPFVIGAQRGLLDLWRALENAGFAPSIWDATSDGPLSSEVDLLVLAGPRLSYSRAAESAIRDHMARGGRVLAALGDELSVGPGSLVELLTSFGIRTAEGFVCTQTFDPLLRDLVDGRAECAIVTIGPDELSSSHPVTVPLRVGLGCRVELSRSFVRGVVPQGGTFQELVFSPEEAWRDLPSIENGRYDFAYEPGREQVGRHPLVVATEWATPSGARTKVIAFGSTSSLTILFEESRGLVMNAFEWLVDREHRVRIAPKSPYTAVLDRSRPALLRAVTWTGTLGFPALCLLVGTILVVRRRR